MHGGYIPEKPVIKPPFWMKIMLADQDVTYQFDTEKLLLTLAVNICPVLILRVFQLLPQLRICMLL